MAFTSKLATIESRLGNIQLAALGGGAEVQFLSTSNALTINQSVHGYISHSHIDQNIAFSQDVSVNVIYERALSDTLTFYNVTDFVQIRPVSNEITFSQDVVESLTKGVGNDLTISQTLDLSWIHTDNVFQSFLISQSVEISRVLPREVTNTLILVQDVNAVRVRSFTLESELPLGQGLSAVAILNVTNTITFDQTVTSARTIFRSLNSVLTLSQSIERAVTYNLTVSNDLIFKSSHLRGLPDGGFTYVPDVMYTIPRDVVILQVPSRAITFNLPNFGDREGGLGSIITQRTINGTTYTYVRKTGLRKLAYTFSIPRAKAQEFRRFVLDFLSEPMRLTNWKGEIWYGYLTNNPFPIVARRRSMPCDEEESEIEIEFEGIKMH